MLHQGLQQHIDEMIRRSHLDSSGDDLEFKDRLNLHAGRIFELYLSLYEHHPQCEQQFHELLLLLIRNHRERADLLRAADKAKQNDIPWYLDNKLSGMSLYVDRCCGTLHDLANRLDYFDELGIKLLHLMPLFESPPGESDGGYAVSDFKKVAAPFGTLEDLRALQKKMQQRGMLLMLDIVLNHTSHHHMWARKARQGDKQFQEYYYFYNDRSMPDEYELTMPEIFPEAAPGSFTYLPECDKWVMTVFHNYQWDLNYTNPHVLVEMMDTIFFYANLGVDVLRIDAPAFIWKQLETTCQNLPQAHTLLQLIRQCVEVAAPGMTLLGEAIVEPEKILEYFGHADECHFAYNATQMALQWDMLATADTRVMLGAQHILNRKPYGSSWITYTRCHDDIGLGYDDFMIRNAGFDPFAHRKFMRDYYTGQFAGSTAVGALFSSNPKTGDARISGSLASLCGLEKALVENNEAGIERSIQKILLMQAYSFFLGGLPMLYYGDEVGYTNDYSYLQDAGKSYDSRWMHRPLITWEKNERRKIKGSMEERLFSNMQRLLRLRSTLAMVADHSNIMWLSAHQPAVAGYVRSRGSDRLYCIFNFSHSPAFLTWFAFREKGNPPAWLYDHWGEKKYFVGADEQYLEIPSYGFLLLEPANS